MKWRKVDRNITAYEYASTKVCTKEQRLGLQDDTTMAHDRNRIDVTHTHTHTHAHTHAPYLGIPANPPTGSRGLCTSGAALITLT